MKLYELHKAYAQAMDVIEQADDEGLTDEQWGALENIEDAFNSKIENVAKAFKNVDAEQKAIKAERERLQARERTLARRANWFKGYLHHAMTRTGKDKVKGEVLTVSLRKCPASCDVFDVDSVPGAFKRTVTEVKVDRKAIIDHFKDTGEILDGVNIVDDRKTVSIR